MKTDHNLPRVLRHFLPVALALGISTPAIGQTGGADVAADYSILETFEPSYFDQFSPQTAFDMLARVPGFALRDGGNERGFGEATANFLINGSRPSTKNQNARNILSRIPALTVVRIEIIDGATLEIANLTGPVANIVTKSDGISGTWEYAARFRRYTRPQLLEGEVVLSGKRGEVDFTVSLENDQTLRGEVGRDQLFSADNEVLEDRFEQIGRDNMFQELNAGLSWKPSDDHVGNLVLSLRNRDFAFILTEEVQALMPGQFEGLSQLNIDQDEWRFELGADYSFPLGRGNLKLIALRRSERSDIVSALARTEQGLPTETSTFVERSETSESIGRVEYALAIDESHNLQFSAEYAFNDLDAVTRFSNSATEGRDNFVLVKEDRWQSRITHGWKVSERVTWQNALGFEFSTIQSKLPDQSQEAFFRPRGQTNLSYKLDEVHYLRARLERSIGQLNFDNFVDSRNLQDRVQFSGNASLVPDQRTEVSLVLERQDEEFLSGQIEVFYQWIDDPVDRVLLQDGTEGIGNLERAQFMGLLINATLLFDTLGVPGLRLDAEAGVFSSSVVDPLLERSRPVSGTSKWAWNATLRYDWPNTPWAFQAFAFDRRIAPTFRFDERTELKSSNPDLTLTVQRKDFFGMLLEVSLRDPFNLTQTREREVFGTAERRLGDLTARERFERTRGPRLSFQLSGTF